METRTSNSERILEGSPSIPNFQDLRWDKTGNSLLFRWNRIYHPVLHILTRICKQDILNLAFEEVKILENNSLFRPEFISQRVELVPIVNHGSENLKEIASCSCLQTKCEKCTLIFHLKVENKHRFKPLAVTSESLICSRRDWSGISVLPHIPLLELNPGQKVEIQAEAHLYTPKKNARYAVCSKATYVLMTTIDVDPPYRMSEINASHKQYDYDVILESIGTVAPEKIFLKSFELLKDKIHQFAEIVRKEIAKHPS